jgi:hypothetical protein
VPRGGSRGRVLAARWPRFSALRVRLEDASVRGVLDTDWLWLLRGAPSLWEVREVRETALTLDCGRGCEATEEEAVGGGRGEGSRPPLVVLEKEGCVCWLPWADSGLRKGAAVAEVKPLPLPLPLPLSLRRRSARDLLAMGSES